jgi:GNAT superfamily N-acetyltransferase
MMASAFGFGLAAADVMVLVDALELLQDRYHSRWYLAFSDDREEPVAFSCLAHTNVPGVVWLVLSATLEEYRGRGIYRSFVARRIADARAEGAQAAVLQAVRETSAPICQRLGFAEVGALELYAWTPEGT